jgi:hypothetical protein
MLTPIRDILALDSKSRNSSFDKRPERDLKIERSLKLDCAHA